MSSKENLLITSEHAILSHKKLMDQCYIALQACRFQGNDHFKQHACCTKKTIRSKNLQISSHGFETFLGFALLAARSCILKNSIHSYLMHFQKKKV